MGARDLRIAQGIKIKTTVQPHVNPHGEVERKSRVKVNNSIRQAVKLGVRIRSGQSIARFKLGPVDMTVPGPYHRPDPAAETELNGLSRFDMAGETWKAWTIDLDDIPGNLVNFTTEFGVDHPDPDGQTVMWAVVPLNESFGGDHVYVGYADLTPP